MTETNWAGNYTYRAKALHRPSTVAELQELVASAPRLRVLGSRHSFNDLADSAELVTLDGLPPDIAVDRSAGTVTCSGSVRYGDLAEVLNAEGVALHNLASLPHISVARAIATATHGSGDTGGNLATAVAGLELVTSTGELLAVRRGDPDFDGAVVHLGALGAVTRVTLDVEPAYEVRQRVFEGLEWDALFEHFDAITSAGYSASVFTNWNPVIEQVWVKSRVEDVPEQVRPDLFGATPAREQRHPIAGMDPIHVTAQQGEPGPWSDRLPHFRMGFTPSGGEEIQSEYLLARRDALPAIRALRPLAGLIQPVLLVSEIRTMAADRLWMSPEYGRDTVGIHFTWKREPEAVVRVIAEVEAVLEPFSARPHWGKLFLFESAAVAPLYERLADFRRLAERLDPRGAFRNAWLERHVLGRP